MRLGRFLIIILFFLAMHGCGRLGNNNDGTKDESDIVDYATQAEQLRIYKKLKADIESMKDR